MDHHSIIQLIIAYTLVGAFVFTVVISCLSVVGWIKFADQKQQNKLFYVLVVELVVGCLAFFFDFIALNPKRIVQNIQNTAVVDYQKRVKKLLTSIDSLPSAKVIEIERKAQDISDNSINNIVKMRDPGNVRLSDPEVARSILKMRLVTGGRTLSDIDRWEEVLGKSNIMLNK